MRLSKVGRSIRIWVYCVGSKLTYLPSVDSLRVEKKGIVASIQALWGIFRNRWRKTSVIKFKTFLFFVIKFKAHGVCLQSPYRAVSFFSPRFYHICTSEKESNKRRFGPIQKSGW